MSDGSILRVKSLAFAIRIVNLYKHLCEKEKEYVLSKQCLKSGTAIGASIRESEFAQSKADFINKLSIALKEATETIYWLILPHKTNYISTDSFDSIRSDADDLLKLLIASIKTSKLNL